MAQTRTRFTGELTLEGVTDEAKAERQGADLSRYFEILRSCESKRAAGHNAPAHGLLVPAAGAQLAETRFREAAKAIGVGVSIERITADSDKGRAAAVPAGRTKLVVQTRERKVVTRKKSAESTAKRGLPPVRK